MSNISQYSTTAGSNNAAVPNGWPENMAPSGVNNCARENMAALAKVYKDQKGSIVTTGSGTAYVLATNNAHAALADICLTVCRIHTINTGSATIAVDGLAAKTLQIKGAALVAGDLPQNVLVLIAYNSTNNTFDVLSTGRENLEDIAALARTNGNIIVGDGTDWVAESGATARTSLGVAIGSDVQAYDAVLDGTTASYTTAEKSKLGTVESGATADQTDAEIKTAYENNANTNEFSDAEQTKLAGIEALADVTDATNVNAAGATMNSDSDVSGASWFIDEDNMVSDSAVKAPSQQSTKKYVDDTVIAIGALSISGTPVTNDFAKFTSGSAIEGRSYAEARADLSLGTSALINTGTTAGLVPLVGTKSASLTLAGLVEQSTSAENVTGSDDTVFPSVAGAKQIVDTHALPTQTGNSGEFLTTNGTVASWAAVDALPTQSGQTGKFLTTNGTAASWASVGGFSYASAQKFS
jgi:hypothetical protein